MVVKSTAPTASEAMPEHVALQPVDGDGPSPVEQKRRQEDDEHKLRIHGYRWQAGDEG
jgi:hypothetical protein